MGVAAVAGFGGCMMSLFISGLLGTPGVCDNCLGGGAEEIGGAGGGVGVGSGGGES